MVPAAWTYSNQFELWPPPLHHISVSWSGWVWVGECFFWYRPTRVVLDKRPLNDCVCVCYWQCYYIHTHTHTHTHLTGWAGTRKVKPIWFILKQVTASGSGIIWAICKSAPCFGQITMPATHHSVFTGQIPLLSPNQQCQSTEGKHSQNAHIAIHLHGGSKK